MKMSLSQISYKIVRPASLANMSPIDWEIELWLTFLKPRVLASGNSTSEL